MNVDVWAGWCAVDLTAIEPGPNEDEGENDEMKLEMKCPLSLAAAASNPVPSCVQCSDPNQ